MRRLVPLLVLALGCGCDPPAPAGAGNPPSAAAVPAPTVTGSYDLTADGRTCSLQLLSVSPDGRVVADASSGDERLAVDARISGNTFTARLTPLESTDDERVTWVVDVPLDGDRLGTQGEVASITSTGQTRGRLSVSSEEAPR